MIIKLQSSLLTKPGLGDLNQRFYPDKPDRSSPGNGLGSFSKAERKALVMEGKNAPDSIDDLCMKTGIDRATFNLWAYEFLNGSSRALHEDVRRKVRNQSHRFNVVIEGRTGETSVAEICRREAITQDDFLKWTKEFIEVRREELKTYRTQGKYYRQNKELLMKFCGPDVFNYLDHYLDLGSDEAMVHLKSESERLDVVQEKETIVGIQRLNDVRHINKYLEKVNSKLAENGLFAGRFETFTARRERKGINRIPLISDVYFFIEFLLKRILPKVGFTKRLYFNFTKGNDRLLSKAEGLGRLVSCGFKIMDYKSIDGMVYFVVKKIREPYFDENPSYGPVYRMPRLGKNGKVIKVYKFRTMHPYSEYLQDYIVNSNGYAETGKPAEDFRIPKWGKFMRRFWLDELPQVINLLKGEMKLVGIRPVSQRYFQDIPKEMQKLRLTQKPGCIPPYVSLNRDGNVMSVLRAEKDYLEEKLRNPYSTDLKYFFQALYNILIRHKRSA